MSHRGRRLKMGLATVLGLRRQGYFLPYRYADQVPPPETAGPYPALEPWFEAAAPAFAQVLSWIEALAPDLERIPVAPGQQGGAADKARWGQDWFPRLDAAAAYAITRHLRPARLIEVGSGHSTRFFARAVRDGGLATAITAIDPAPRADIADGAITIHRQTVQSAGLARFATLAPGDVLMIDSSHLLVPGGDVDLLLNGVLPGLPPGVWIHIHDIFLPDGYPPAWGWRGYAEQSAVAPLIHGGGYALRWASHWLSRQRPEPWPAVLDRLPLLPGAMETSLWLEKRGPG